VLREAYEIRLYAINEYGRVIHEFDPYFNYRAAEYLWQHGTSKFFKWFDYMSWYPLGRPVGTTIYPGMQFTTMWIKMFVLPDWSINDICCFVPAWFGSIATLATALLCYVCVQSIASTNPSRRSILQDIPVIDFLTNKILLPAIQFPMNKLKSTIGTDLGLATYHKNPPALESAIFTACFMSIVPAHLTRSIGGGYDNESVATTAMQMTYFLWTATLWVPDGMPTIICAVLAGLGYFYMAAAWGGYIFVINLIGIHATFLVFFRKCKSWDKIYTSYSIFYAVGVLLAMQLPVVNWQPIKSLEQIGPLLVFAGLQVLQLMFYLEKRRPEPKGWADRWNFRLAVLMGCAAAAAPVVYYLWSTGFFGPLSSRVRGLFVKHTKTGNPLVDSVAEHQAAKPEAYYQYLNIVMTLAPYGFGIVALIGCTPSSSFLLLYGLSTFYFSNKMNRLVLLTGPIASICAGIACGYVWAWIVSGVFGTDDRPSIHSMLMMDGNEEEETETEAEAARKALLEEEKEKTAKAEAAAAKKRRFTKGGGGATADAKKEEDDASKAAEDADAPKPKASMDWGDPIWSRIIRLAVGVFIVMQAKPHGEKFYEICHSMAERLSHPTIIMKGRTNKGETVMVDDYREAYLWLNENTPEDARIMAWWDYGYQITGIANRTTIADGNTWNHEHIALLGRALTSPEREGHRIARHLADYVLVWAGGGGDDLAKSPHLRRIANSVYSGLCIEPTCRGFGFIARGKPSLPLRRSLLYTLHSHNLAPEVKADPQRFREVFKSKYGKVRIFKVLKVSEESKQWVLDNRKCDAPGSWYCPGQYPPALQKVLDQKRDFAQLEDFNKGSAGGDAEYQKQYFENLNNPEEARKRAIQQQRAEAISDKVKTSVSPEGQQQLHVDVHKITNEEEIEDYNKHWEDSEMTGKLYETISSGNIQGFANLITTYPAYAHARSADGRGPMWWAHEFKRPNMVKILKYAGVSETRKDKNGMTPLDVSKL